jgi:thioredoxin-dependent peroxiredoxin
MLRKLITPILALCCAGAANAEENMIAKPYAAPTVTAPDQDGTPVVFPDVAATGLTVVFFYPKALTPGCTNQACSLRDAHKELGKLGVQVFGVSTDTQQKQQEFKKQKNLPYRLIADTEGKVMAAFKVGSAIPFLNFANREAFIIKDGQVVWHDPSASTTEQAADIKTALEKLK